jgi:hypothetical protein
VILLGAVDLITRRRMLSTETVFVRSTAEQRNAAARAPARLVNLLVRGLPMSLSDRVVVGLVAATGLTRRLLHNSGTHRNAPARRRAGPGRVHGGLRGLGANRQAAVRAIGRRPPRGCWWRV